MLHSRCGLLLLLCVCPLACLHVSLCPSGCCCCSHPGLLVLCESLGLRSVPPSVPLGTSALSLSRNRLCNVDQQLKSFSELQQLSLSHNLLTRFPRGLPPSLECLLLQANRLTYITSGVLRPLGNLTRLDLEHNRIRAIQPGALQELHKLQILVLKGNRLTVLPPSLPSSLVYLDLSANWISVLDVASLTSLWNLQVLKCNSHCLRPTAERALDTPPRRPPPELADLQRVCQCDIMYLHRWLLSTRAGTRTDRRCTDPSLLVQQLTVKLSVPTSCPHSAKPSNRTPRGGGAARPKSHRDGTDGAHLLRTASNRTASEPRSDRQHLRDSHVFYYSLETLTYECLSADPSRPAPPSVLTAAPPPEDEQRCRENVTARSAPDRTSAEGTRFPPSSATDGPGPTAAPPPLTHRDWRVMVALLAVLCVFVALLMVAALLLVKQALQRRQRVAPLNVLAAR